MHVREWKSVSVCMWLGDGDQRIMRVREGESTSVSVCVCVVGSSKAYACERVEECECVRVCGGVIKVCVCVCVRVRVSVRWESGGWDVDNSPTVQAYIYAELTRLL